MRTVLVLIFLLLMVFFALENQLQTTVILGPFAITQSVAIIVISNIHCWGDHWKGRYATKSHTG